MTTDALSLGALLRKHGLHLKKGLGQNFLADPVHLERIVAAANLARSDVVLEVGAGVGTLTARLARKAGRVVAVELDASLLPPLREALAGYDNVAIVQGDILELDPAQLIANGQSSIANGQLPIVNCQSSIANGQVPIVNGTPTATADSLTIDHSPLTIDHYKVVANLPYYITSAVIRRLLTAQPRPALLALTVQREVAQRIVAQPPEMSLLAVSVQFYARPEIVARIPAGAFYPAPKVDSAVLRLTPFAAPPVDAPNVEQFFAVARAGFGQRRKQLRNALKAGLALPADAVESALQQAGIAPQRRAETLSLAEWARLAQAFRPQDG